MLRLFQIAFGAIVTLKALSLLAKESFDAGAVSPLAWIVIPAGLLMAAGAVSIAAGRNVRPAAATVVATSFVFMEPVGVYNHHLYLIAVVAAILAISIQVELMLKLQLSIVYLFGTLTKINEGFLSGTELHVSVVEHLLWRTLVGVPIPAWALIAISIITVILEGFLVFAFWFPRARWVALVVGLGLHAGMLVLISDDLARFVNLVVYAGVMYTLYMPFFADKLDARWQALQVKRRRTRVLVDA